MKLNKAVAILTRPHWIFVIVALMFGVVFVGLTPPLWGLDEPSHFARAYQISRGELLPHVKDGSIGDLMPDNFIKLTNYRTYDILDVIHGSDIIHRKDVTDASMYDKIGDAVPSSSQSDFWSFATYSPVAYPGAVIGIVISNILKLTLLQTLFLARLFSLIVYVAIAAFAIWLMRDKKLVWLFFIMALVPTAIFQASTISADNVLIGLSLLFFALFFRALLDDSKNKKVFFGLIAAAIMLPLVKVNYIFISFALLFVPGDFFLSKKVSVIYKTASLSFAVIASVAWTHLTKVTSVSLISQRADHVSIVPTEQISFIISHPLYFIEASLRSIIIYGDRYYQQALFTISDNTIALPIILTVMLSIVLVGIPIYARAEIQNVRKQICLLGVGAIASSITIFAALYVAFTPTGWWFVDGIQGRYFTPLIIPIVLLVTLMIPVKLQVHKPNLARMVYFVSVVCLGVGAVYLYQALY